MKNNFDVATIQPKAPFTSSSLILPVADGEEVFNELAGEPSEQFHCDHRASHIYWRLLRRRALANLALPSEFPLTINLEVRRRLSRKPHGLTNSSVVVVIIVYCVLFIIGAPGNLSVVVSLFKSKHHRRSRISLMICHLAVADLMVAFFTIPFEIGWRIAVEWYAGNIACKVFTFIRSFSLYLSSNVLVCVALDRCFAVVYPLRLQDAQRRGKVMLICAWLVAMLSSMPQIVIYHVAHRPGVPEFQQCVTFGFFQSDNAESVYNFICVVLMYFMPLLVICVAYTMIVCEITKRTLRSRERDDGKDRTASGALRLRCNALTQIERARQKTFKLTVIIVVVFIWCWTPYVVMALWYVFDRKSAEKVDSLVQEGLFLMAVSNSCMNPLIYGSFAMKCRFPWSRKPAVTHVLSEQPGLHRRSTGRGLARIINEEMC
ncbi:adipokinetic hormone/corazonin-related peptide receptor variant I-like [Phlebotomus argentipes]|uniref:adipokinetic hormone/corazonin-related peptide receptor variant I-like n=1 Tax=Phlebotomus argentipes TaxID=94469 RepID=UPI0028935543|nr:adipokinetic hormone/corazonin-related peptide receptor variant I-like [Phlebotomus argentipes]